MQAWEVEQAIAANDSLIVELDREVCRLGSRVENCRKVREGLHLLLADMRRPARPVLRDEALALARTVRYQLSEDEAVNICQIALGRPR